MIRKTMPVKGGGGGGGGGGEGGKKELETRDIIKFPGIFLFRFDLF